MKELELARFIREDIYKDKGKHIPPLTVTARYPVEIDCVHLDYTEERDDGVLFNGETPKDQFVVYVINRYGQTIGCWRHEDRNAANRCFLAFTKQNKGFKRA